MHNGVGSALLVPTVMGIPEPRSVERVTVQFLRFSFYLNAGYGAAGKKYYAFMKTLRFLQFMLMSVLLFGFVACGGDDDDEASSSSSSPLVGRWKYRNVTLVIESDNTGYRKREFDEEPADYDCFAWKCTDTQLFLSYDGKGDIEEYERTYMYYYTIVDDILSLHYDDGEYMGAYKRQ